MNSEPQWTDLHCYCGSRDFHVRIGLRHRPGGGTTETPTGYVCRQCQADVDTAGLIRLQTVEMKKRELQALQAEVGQQTGIAAAARKDRRDASP
jgi:hypothetical protein